MVFSFFNDSFKNQEVKKDEITIISENNEEKSINIEDYIIGVVACEMPALYQEEALKAQAVASRTYAYYLLEHNKNTVLTDTRDQCYIDKTQMQEKWGNNYEKYYQKIKKAVINTDKIVMTKNNQVFKSFYFSTSNGTTLDSITVFKEGNITSTSSSWDKDSKDYKKTVSFSKEELAKKLGNFKEIKIKSRDKTNHVNEVQVDNKTYTGIEFRKLLELRSTDFDITVNNNNYMITTRGYGHGVGMSQYGANYLASNGKNYKEILEYYYNDISFLTY